MFINFKEAFTFMFKDEKFWKKYAVGTLLNVIFLGFMCVLIPAFMDMGRAADDAALIKAFLIVLGSCFGIFIGFLPMLFGIGYCVNYANQKIVTGSNELPEWGGNFKKFFVDGIKIWAGLFLVSLSFSVAMGVMQFICLIVMLILGAISSFSNSDAGAIVFLISLLIIVLLYIVLSVVFTAFYQLAMASFLVDKNILAVFNFKRIKSLLKGNIINLLLIFLFGIIFCVVGGILLLLMSFVPVIAFVLCLPFSFYTMLVTYNIVAQYVQIGTIKNQQRLETVKSESEVQTENKEENI